MRTRTARWGISTAVLVVAGLALTACGPDNSSSSADSTSSATSAPSATGGVNGGATSDSSNSSGSSGATSSSNSSGSSGATSSSGGQDVDSVIPKGTPNKAGVKCTNQIDYAKDTRNNADINSIGSTTGYCPPVTMTGKLVYGGGQLEVTGAYSSPSSFDITDESNIYGASLICSNNGDAGMPDKDGYGTIPCTEKQLVAAAQKGNVNVRVILDPASTSTAVLVQEKFVS